jgi:hypothetical protein
VGSIPRCRGEDVDAAVQADGDRMAGLDVLDNGRPLHEMRKVVPASVTQLRHVAGLMLHSLIGPEAG